MDDTTGAFNYSGLVANMEEKAGMFYGMHVSFRRLETLCKRMLTRYSRIPDFLGLVDGEYQAGPGLFDAEYHTWYSCSRSIGR